MLLALGRQVTDQDIPEEFLKTTTFDTGVGSRTWSEEENTAALALSLKIFDERERVKAEPASRQRRSDEEIYNQSDESEDETDASEESDKPDDDWNEGVDV
jgi:hypothetical protein